MIKQVVTSTEVNALAARLRAEGFVVQVRKTEVGFEVVAREGGKPSSYQPKTTKYGEEVIFFSLSEFRIGERMANELRKQGIPCHFGKAKSGKCWFLKKLA